MKQNKHIREKLKENKIFQWQLALEIGVSEVTLIRWLRIPLSEEKEKSITHAISSLIEKKK